MALRGVIHHHGLVCVDFSGPWSGPACVDFSGPWSSLGCVDFFGPWSDLGGPLWAVVQSELRSLDCDWFCVEFSAFWLVEWSSLHFGWFCAKIWFCVELSTL